ncbi:MAG: NAD(P)-dependent alcohol dehydrogenase [Humibacillus sp.]|nr:NAD(P)-dependent alcohol dehydrogenase [Humibacillus sp.]MDN5776588.1 NAD(P)-dependent alcohol dehydrogenase [Humibacillus sp.]
MRVAVLNRPGEIEVVERADPAPGPEEVRVRVAAVGVCGSDTHYFDHGRIGNFVVESPLVLGHEASGVIDAVGPAVDESRVGQRVSIEPGVPCRTCEQCLAGRYNLCPLMRFHATPPIDGSLAELVVTHEAFAHPVPDSVSDEAAALLEPLSVGIWSARKAHVGIGSRVLVTGAGPIGLVAVQVARAAGAVAVTVVDLNDERLRVATDLGATAVVNPSRDALADAIDGAAPHALIECTGNAAVTKQGVSALAPAGRAVLVGMGGDEVALPLSAIQEHELVVTGTFRYANTWPTAIGMVSAGIVDLDRLVTSRHRLDQSAEALVAGRSDPKGIKAVVSPQR